MTPVKKKILKNGWGSLILSEEWVVIHYTL
jgi:hypothetical protein